MATAKTTASDKADDPTMGGALPDPAGTSLHEQFQAGLITYKEFVNLSTEPPAEPPAP